MARFSSSFSEARRITTGRDFPLLVIGQTASVLGDGLVPVALSFAVLEIGGSATDLGIVFAASLTPLIVLSLLAGVLADRFPRKRLMIGSDITRGLAQGLTAALLITGEAEIWHLVVLQAIYGAADAFFRPAMTAFVPQVVDAERLQQANALLGLSTNASSIVGPALAGVMVATVGPGVALAGDAMTFLVSALALLGIRPRPAHAVPHPGAGGIVRRALVDLRAGAHELRLRTWLWVELLRGGLTLLMVAAPFLVLGPIISQRSLGGAGAWAAIVTASSVGMVAGSALALRWRPQRPLFVGVALGLVAAPASALLALAAPVPLIVAATFVKGVWAGLFVAIWVTLLQEHIPTHALARVSAWDWTATFALMPAGYALAGPLADAFGAEAVLWAGVIVTLTSTPLVLAVPAVRNLKPRPAVTVRPGIAAEAL